MMAKYIYTTVLQSHSLNLMRSGFEYKMVATSDINEWGTFHTQQGRLHVTPRPNWIYLFSMSMADMVCRLLTSFHLSSGTRRVCWAAKASASSSCWPNWPCAPCDRAYGKTTDQTNARAARWERGMEDEIRVAE